MNKKKLFTICLALASLLVVVAIVRINDRTELVSGPAQISSPVEQGRLAVPPPNLDETEIANPEPASDIGFNLTDYALEFESSISEELQSTIIQDLGLFLNGKAFELIAPRNPSQFASEFAGELVSPTYRIRFTDELGVGYRVPVALENIQQYTRSYTQLYERDGELTLMVRDQLIDLYRSQLELASQHRDSLDDLSLFIERLNTIENEPISMEWYLDLIYVPQNNVPNDTEFDSQRIEQFMTPFYESSYKSVGLLDIGIASEYLGSTVADSMSLQSGSLIAILESSNPIEVSRDYGQVVPVVFENGNWRLLMPIF